MLALLPLVVLLFLFPAYAQAGPGHITPEAPKISKSAKKEARSLARLFDREAKRSRAVWQKDAVQDAWQVDRLCIRDTFRSLDESSPITDLQSLYTLSVVRAISIHTLGPDGQVHSSFKSALRALQTTKVKNRGLRTVLKQKVRYMKAIAALPRYQKSVCPMLRNWQETEKDLLSYSGLSKHSQKIKDFNRAEIYELPYEAYDVVFSLFKTRTEEDYMEAEKFAQWFATSVPYLQGLWANQEIWKNWSGENYPR